MARTKTKNVKAVIAPVVNGRAVRAVGLIVAALLAGQALVLWWVARGGRLPLHVSYATNDSLMTKLTGTNVTAPAVHQIGTVSLTALLISLLIVIGALIALQVTGTLNKLLRGRINEQRTTWLIIAAAAAGLLVITNLLAGDYDVRNLLLIILVGFGATVAGLHATMVGIGGKRRAMYVAVAAVPWLWVLWTLSASSMYGTMHALGAVWLLLLTSVVGIKLAGLHIWLAQRGYKQWANGTLAAAGPSVILLIAESAFVWQVFAAFLHG